MSEIYAQIKKAVTEKSMLRLIVKLKPANADGLVYPPTYDKGQHIFRPSWVDGEEREAVLLDSVQSQANRIETALLQAMKRRKFKYPDIEVTVNLENEIEQYSVLELSHRVYDAALRMSNVDGTSFPQTAIGEAIYAARADRATALFEHAPVTLVLGGWDSHGGGGPLVAKLPRLITSEIVGLDAKPVTRAAVKFDPMDIRKEAGPIYESASEDRLFELDKDKAKKPKELNPSEIGLGNVPNVSERGAVITEAIQTSLISLTAARRLRFERNDSGGGNQDIYSDDRDLAGQTVVVALGLYGLLAQMEEGYNLRSGCDLIPVKAPRLEIIGRTLEEVETYSVTVDGVLQALEQAKGDAKNQGLVWREEPLHATADDVLTTLIQRSRTAKSGAE